MSNVIIRKKSSADILKTFCQTTSFHLLSRVPSKKENIADVNNSVKKPCCKLKHSIGSTIKRIIFLFLFLTSLGWSLRSVYVIGLDYFRYPTITSIELKPLDEIPAVTICALPNENGDDQRDPFSSTPMVVFTTFSPGEIIVGRRKRDAHASFQASIRYGKELDHKNERDTRLLDCLSQPYITRNHKYCYTCNAANFENGSSQIGYEPKFYGKLDEEITYTLKNFNLRKTLSWTQMVYIHPRNHHFSSSLAVSVPFLAEDEIHVSKKIYSSPSQPYTQCRNIKDDKNKQINFFSDTFTYDVNFCRQSCYQAHFMSINHESCLRDIPCNPNNLSVAFGWDLSKSSSPINYERIHLVYSYKDLTTPYISARQKEEARVCDRICPEPCVKASYLTSVVRFISGGDFRGSEEFQTITVKFKGQMEAFETEPKYDVYNFISSIGGTLGLFTGFSLLTAVEVMELGARLATLLCHRAASFLRGLREAKAKFKLPKKLFGRSRRVKQAQGKPELG